ncbi:hypothetical protein ACC771_00205, partial [Rhizobium ruizarguesonis]
RLSNAQQAIHVPSRTFQLDEFDRRIIRFDNRSCLSHCVSRKNQVFIGIDQHHGHLDIQEPFVQATFGLSSDEQLIGARQIKEMVRI